MLSKTARRITRFSFGFALGIAATAVLASLYVSLSRTHEVRVGSGHAYAILGDLPVQHRGRVKPLSSLAIEEIKLIYGSPTIRLRGPDGKTTSSWDSVAALLGWSVRPEFWDNQDLILVEYPPLRRLLMGASIREQLRSLAGTAGPAVRRSLQALAAQPDLTDADLRQAAQKLGEPSTTGKSLFALAAWVAEDHKWISPRVLENTPLEYEGHTLTFTQWVGEILNRNDRARSDGIGAASKLTPIERMATELGERFSHYRAIREHTSPAAKLLDLQVAPRPFNDIYRKYTTECFEKGMKPDQTLSPLEANVANALVQYLVGLENKQWALPGEDGVFDQKFVVWLHKHSTWIPLGIILNSDDTELSRAGLPSQEVVAFRKSYRDFENAERAAPGDAPEAIALAVTAAARDLGTNLGDYPHSSEMARETYFYRVAPFSRAPLAYGFGLALLLLSIGITATERKAATKLGAAFYWLGMAGIMAGIVLELYGFFLGCRAFGHFPVTNLYGTVIFAALAASGLGLALELLWRKKYAALTASGIALLATVLAENVSVLDPSIAKLVPLAEMLPVVDPSIPAVVPVDQINRWLLGHVLSIVSSYATFAIALGLGLLALGHYLTASYRRSPSYRELAWPLLPGIPLYVLGRLGIEPSWQLLPEAVVDPGLLSYVSSGLAAIGGVLTIVGSLSVLGELANRSPRRACTLGVILAAAFSAGLIAATTGAVRGPVASALTSYDAWFVGFLGGALIVMGLLGSQAREAFARIEPLAKFIYRAILLGILLLALGTIVGCAWARVAWGGFSAWEPKLVWALITLVVYLVPLLGRFAGWMSTFGLVAASVVCFMAVLMSWYGVNFVLRVGRHSYGSTEGGDPRIVMACALALLAIVGAAAWRRSRSR